jgi:Golgi phosphoprotein 3 (GPP34)
MQAETPKAEVNLPQAFLLLATNDKDGKPELPMFELRTTLAGAILAELDLVGAIGLQGKHVRATGTAPQTDFQHELDLIRGKRPHTPKQWVSMLEGRAEMQRVYEGMASLGIVEPAGEKHLGLFRTVRYPEKDHAPEAALLKRIEAALSGPPSDAGPSRSSASEATADSEAPASDAGASSKDGTPDSVVSDAGPASGVPDRTAADAGASGDGTPGPEKANPKASDARTTALIALLQASGLLGRLFPAADKSWVDELAKDYWPAHAVENELLMGRLAQAEAPTL